MVIIGFFAGGMCYAQEFSELPFASSEPSESAESEESTEIETDRDSFTPATTTAGRGLVIVESAYTFIDNASVPETHSYPELLVRRGIGDWLELRLGWNYEIGGAGSPVSGNTPGILNEEPELEEESRFLYGFKSRFTEQDRWLPESAMIVQGYTPTSGKADATDVSAGYVFGWTLPSEIVWDTSIRYSTARLEEDDFNVWAPSTVVKIPIGERCKAHVEYFGIFSEGRANETVQQFFSPGAHYLINDNLEVGLRVGWGLNDEAPNFFSNVGFGWRF
jgi:hypothetical protein